jgi:hypothetical protein
MNPVSWGKGTPGVQTPHKPKCDILISTNVKSLDRALFPTFKKLAQPLQTLLNAIRNPSLIKHTGAHTMKRIVCISTIALLAACDTQPVQEDAEIGRIGGYVTDLEGNPIEGVSIEAQGLTAESGEDGLYYIDGVSPSENILVTFKKRGFAKGYNNTSIISWETVGVDGTMLAIDGTGTLMGNAGGMIEVEGVTVDFDPSAIITADGSPYAGQVTVEVTHLDPHTEMDAAPGDLTALSFSLAGNSSAKDALTDAQLVSYGMLDVTLFAEDGEELNIDADSPVAISMPISNGELPSVYQMADGDQQNTWSFLPEQGRWVEEGMGTVVADEEGKLSFDFEASHFSWWNCDQGMVPTCASGRVIDMLGFPVRCATSTTDENGYYVCSVLTGDTVSFIGETFVANSWAWDKNIPVKFMDGEGSSAATCEPIQTIQIEVCRETGVVSVQNVQAVTETAGAGNTVADSDTVAAFFWEPPGYPQFCDNPWKDMALDSCQTFDTNSTGTHFPNVSNSGLPSNGRSVGTYLEVSTPRKDYRMMRDQLGNTPVYVWDNENISNGTLTDTGPDIRSNDDLHVYAPGDVSNYAGIWDESYFAQVPNQALMDDDSFFENSGANVSLSYNGTDGGDLLVMAASMGDGDSSESMICRMANDGNITLPSSAMNGMDRGYAGLGIYNADTGWAMGPDGLPVRLQIFSGSTTLVTLK